MPVDHETTLLFRHARPSVQPVRPARSPSLTGLTGLTGMLLSSIHWVPARSMRARRIANYDLLSHVTHDMSLRALFAKQSPPREGDCSSANHRSVDVAKFAR